MNGACIARLAFPTQPASETGYRESINNAIEIMTRIHARFPTFNEDREQAPREGSVTVLQGLMSLAVSGTRLEARLPSGLGQRFRKTPCELSQTTILP
jgi:hypothetical protein